jgi:hypothetical protein
LSDDIIAFILPQKTIDSVSFFKVSGLMRATRHFRATCGFR